MAARWHLDISTSSTFVHFCVVARHIMNVRKIHHQKTLLDFAPRGTPTRTPKVSARLPTVELIVE